jgi:hypothetical protein
MGIKDPVYDDFNTAYNKWILSRNVYVDKYGFTVPLGKYHPKLTSKDAIDIEDVDLQLVDDDEEENKDQKINRRRTPEKRVKHAVSLLPALKKHNLELKKKESFRPDYEEILFHFKQLQMYCNNEAKVKANEVRQEYCWNDYIMMVTDNIHDNSEQGKDQEDSDDEDEFNKRSQGHMFSVAKRSSWKPNSWQNEDIWALCRLGISHNLRSRIWYDLLEVQSIENLTFNKFMEEPDYDEAITIYDNFKVLITKYDNIAFAQIDEDMRMLDVSNTPSRDDCGKIKNILKSFVVWQQITKENLCYSINFGYIIQRLLSIFTEERTFWIFLSIIAKMKSRIGVEESIMLDRKGMFRMISTCLCTHTKETYPEVYAKFTEVGFSLDFFLYDKMSSLFSNCFASDTLLRLWDLIFLEFSSPNGGGKSKGLGYIVSTCIYLISINKDQIMKATTPEQLYIALDNSRSAIFNTEEIIEEIFNLNTQNFVAGNWFSRRLASISKSFGDAASYLDNARIALEEDYDLIFEKTMRENRVVWNLLHNEENEQIIDYNVWNDGTESSILSKFKL